MLSESYGALTPKPPICKTAQRRFLIMIKKILVPVDGSEHAKKAVTYAADLALKYDAKVYLLHVVPESKVPEGLDKYIEIERIKEPPEIVLLQKVGDAIIEAGQEEARQKGLDKVEASVVLGDPGEKILEFSKNNGIDMIIMGSRGLGGVKSLFLGSVSSKVCHLADTTCVTVK
jgi:nucleotide-binding universal stress UspA family protein